MFKTVLKQASKVASQRATTTAACRLAYARSAAMGVPRASNFMTPMTGVRLFSTDPKQTTEIEVEAV